MWLLVRFGSGRVESQHPNDFDESGPVSVVSKQCLIQESALYQPVKRGSVGRILSSNRGLVGSLINNFPMWLSCPVGRGDSTKNGGSLQTFKFSCAYICVLKHVQNAKCVLFNM